MKFVDKIFTWFSIFQEERAWRERTLQEAKEKKRKNEREIKEKNRQLRVKEEMKLNSKIKEKEEAKLFQNHSIVSSDREEKDLLKIENVEFFKQFLFKGLAF